MQITAGRGGGVREGACRRVHAVGILEMTVDVDGCVMLG